MPDIDDGYGNAKTTRNRKSTRGGTQSDDVRQQLEGAQVKLGNAKYDKDGMYVVTAKGLAAQAAADKKASDASDIAAAAAKRAITQAEGKAAQAAADKEASDASDIAAAAAKRTITQAEAKAAQAAADKKASDASDIAAAAAKRTITKTITDAETDFLNDNSAKGADDGTGLITLAQTNTGTVTDTNTGTGTDSSVTAAVAALQAKLDAATAAAAAAVNAAKIASAADKAAAEKLAKETAAKAEALRIERDNLASVDKLNTRIGTTIETDKSVEETGLVSSWMPDWLKESLKGEGNYDPAWVEKNKAAGAKSLENMYASGQLQRPISNITDSYGNAIGGVANSQDNTAMQRLAAEGSTDPMGDLSSQVVKEDGIDSSFTGAFNQAINGADGSEYTGGGGLLKFSQDQDKKAIFGDALAPPADINATNTIDSNEDGDIDAAESTTLSLEKFRDNLGFASAVQAQAFWDSMTPEEQVIFNSKENPSSGTKMLQSIFGLFIPGAGLLEEFMYNDDMTLQEKFDYAVNTAKTVSENKDKLVSVADSQGGASEGVVDTPDGSVENPDLAESDTVKYQTLESYLAIFNNYKF